MPAEVISSNPGENTALVDVLGARREVSTLLVPPVAPGDWVVVHVGFALAVLDPDEARSDLALLDEALRADSSLPEAAPVVASNPTEGAAPSVHGRGGGG